MSNKTNIEEDIKFVKKYMQDYFYEDIAIEDDFKFEKAIENILADRERPEVKANKYDNLADKIKEKYFEMKKEYERKVYDKKYNTKEAKTEERYKAQVYKEILELLEEVKEEK